MTLEAILKPKSYDEKCRKDEKKKNCSFLCLLVWVFVICCFIGFLVETVYGYIRKGHFVNKQGLLYGPFKPIYGFGGVIFTIIFYRLRNYRSYILFILGSVIGAFYEYFCSYFQEVFMKSRSWDYSKLKYNIDGRVSITHAIYWGLLSLIFIKFALPVIVLLVGKISSNMQNPIMIVWILFMSFNIFMSASAITRQVERLKDIPADNNFEEFLDRHYNDEKIRETFTHMKFVYVDKKTD